MRSKLKYVVSSIAAASGALGVQVQAANQVAPAPG